MNFSLPPRPQSQRNFNATTQRRSTVYGIGSGRHSIDKARYINANYRFMVDPDGDYKEQASNADHHVDWKDVLQILASAESQAASCPICLSHPVAPRMAKCGHIFCLPCLIRYMNSAEDETSHLDKRPRWRKCPICWDAVYISETRPVRWFQGQEGPTPREGDDVVLKLVMRFPGSTLALPRDGATVPAKHDDIPWYYGAEVTDYAHVMKVSRDYMQEQFDREIEELQRQQNEDELMFGEDPEWTKKAIKGVAEARDKVASIRNPPPIHAQPLERQTKRRISPAEMPNASDASMTPQPQSLDDDLSHEVTNDQVDEGPQQARSQQDVPTVASPYFFYQGLLHYYLAPLDIRILKTAFGSFASFPSTLLPRVERVSTGHIVDDELRKRTKYLSHLPYGCEVNFLECNWVGVVPDSILAQFKDDIEKRRKRNREKAVREEKDRQRAEKADDDARWAANRRRHPSIQETADHFHSEPLPALDSGDSSPPWPSRNGPSFSSLASPSTSPLASRTVWGTAAIPPTSPTMLAQRPTTDADVSDGWLSHWEDQLREDQDELIAQVQAASLEQESAAEQSLKSTLTSPTPGRKKKKKITLMSTTARRAA